MLAGFDEAGNGQSVLGLAVVHGVSADDGATGLGGLFHATGEHGGEYFQGQVTRKCGHVERAYGPPAHGVDVAQGVRRGDRAVVERVVDDGWEEVEGLDQGEFVRQTVDGRVVAGLESDQDVRIGEVFTGNWRRTCASSDWLNLPAHPAQPGEGGQPYCFVFGLHL